MCGPGQSDGIFIPECIFGDSIEADDADTEVVIFLVDDNDFDFNDDFNHDNDFNFDDNSRSGTFVG